MTINWENIQNKWQSRWQKANLGKAVFNQNKEKFMMIFAYPGISGFLHVGHMRGFSYTDAICRLERLKGKEVLFPVGTHASGNHAFSFAKKVRDKDEDWINYLLSNGCPKNKIKDLKKPENIIKYFNDVYVNDYWKKFGFLVDWDRFTCTTNKDYEKFIQWQFKKLQQHDMLIQKPYFATACTNCGPVAVDASETDISKGGNAEKNEYTLLKFKLSSDNQEKTDYLVAATLRPETIYGQTNLWINQESQYVRVEVEGENWIMSREAADKLVYQIDDVLLKEDIDPKKLIGKNVLAPGINKEIPILPADFVNKKVGSGIVTCVPSDAPNDYVALRTLKEDQTKRNQLKNQNFDLDIIDQIKLIPIIQSKGYNEFPAKEIVEKLKIKSLDDKKLLDQATKEIYKVGFHSGVMRDNCGQFSGMKVAEAKEGMKLYLLENNKATIFHDLSEEVICRCGAEVIIKRIDDQWFIKYSDNNITKKAKEHVKEMNIYPKEYKEQLPKVLDWFSDRACARLGSWMGSKFPFDEKWTVEPISDSTLYPAFYIVSGYTKRGELQVKDLTENFFDYIFLGKQEDKLKKQVNEEKFKTIIKIKQEFDYFYPLDINLGGKEHKTVHFPVFLMNHVATLPHEKWPKGIFVNWWVTGKGGKISKSKGGAEPIPQAMEKYGVDAMRFYYSHIGSPHVDVVWAEETVLHYKNALERINSLFEEINKIKTNKKSSLDTWLKTEFNVSIRKINDGLEVYNLRELSSETYFSITELFKWYMRRGGGNKKLLITLMKTWVTLMNPITPHLSEELAEKYDLIEDKGTKFVSNSNWPQTNEGEIDIESQANEDLVKNTISGMRNVLKLAKIEQAKKFKIFISEKWLYELIIIIKKELEITRNLGEIIKKVLQNEDFKIKGKEVSKLIGGFIKNPSRMPKVVTSQESEFETLNSAKKFLSDEFSCKIEIIIAEDSNENKAKQSMPGKVGIIVE